MAQKDNSTGAKKTALRRMALTLLDAPVVCETHGGAGRLYRACYADVDQGVVFEKDPKKCEILAGQRPTWSVYEGNCIGAIGAGAGAHLDVNLLDCDPYGDAWPVINAWFDSERPRAGRLVIVVNDGLRQKLKMGGGWNTATMAEALVEFGNSDLHERYLEVCRWLLERKAKTAGYAVEDFQGYHCGHAEQMTHWLAVLTRRAPSPSSPGERKGSEGPDAPGTGATPTHPGGDGSRSPVPHPA